MNWMQNERYPDMEKSQPKFLFTITEACAAIGCGRTRLYELMNSGEIETVRMGSRRLIPYAALKNFADNLQAA